MKYPDVIFAGSAASPEQYPRDGLPEIAFLGRSNVGKSRLLNALVGSKSLARVSSQPGRTRLVNFFRVAHEMYLTDLPGYGFARAPLAERERWETLVTSYLIGRSPLALCVFLIDSRHDPMENDLILHSFLEEYSLPYVLVATKIDKLGRSQVLKRERQLAQGLGANAQAVVTVSATKNIGLQALWGQIRATARSAKGNP